MQIHGLPKTFWLVVSPSTTSTLGDICFECDFRRFAVQIRGGLDEEKIVAVFADEGPAVELAEKMLRAIEEFRQTPGVRIHKAPWPDWYATQSSLTSIAICNRQSAEEVLIEPPKEWGHRWSWNFTEDGTGIIIRQTA
jgi:hypothetical protein